MASSAAKRYAQAVLGLAKDRNTLDAWHADLGRLSEVMSDERAIAFFANPSAPAARKDAILEQVLVDAQPEARNLSQMLSERGRLELLPEIFRLYDEALRAERGIVIAEVTTAEALGTDAEEAVRKRLAALLGKEVELRPNVDPEIIGGIVARVGDQLIDGSVLSQLRRLRARLATSA